MKYERLYLLLVWAVAKALPRLNFNIEWQHDFGHWMLGRLNALGATLTYWYSSPIDN